MVTAGLRVGEKLRDWGEAVKYEALAWRGERASSFRRGAQLYWRVLAWHALGSGFNPRTTEKIK